jgi:FlaA1/EpsC-like NDP-sugar epimerase
MPRWPDELTDAEGAVRRQCLNMGSQIIRIGLASGVVLLLAIVGFGVVGFIDDNPQLRRRRVHGVQILGTAAEIEGVLARRRPDVVLVTIPDAPRERLDFVVAGCETAGIACSFVRREIDLDPAVVLGQASE